MLPSYIMYLSAEGRCRFAHICIVCSAEMIDDMLFYIIRLKMVGFVCLGALIQLTGQRSRESIPSNHPLSQIKSHLTTRQQQW